MSVASQAAQPRTLNISPHHTQMLVATDTAPPSVHITLQPSWRILLVAAFPAVKASVNRTGLDFLYSVYSVFNANIHIWFRNGHEQRGAGGNSLTAAGFRKFDIGRDARTDGLTEHSTDMDAGTCFMVPPSIPPHCAGRKSGFWWAMGHSL